MAPTRSSTLRIGDDSSTVADSERAGDVPSAVAGSERAGNAPPPSAAVEPQNAPVAPPLPLGKDKGKINLIKYPKGSDFLNAAVRHALNMGPSRVGLSYGAIFAERY